MIITAASRGYSSSLFALLGSLKANWPGHPAVLVYDLGLDDGVICKLRAANYAVRKVPAFCPHWRRHYTWKLWCVNDAPAEHVLWLDAGLVALAPMDEVWSAIENEGYFFVTNYGHLDREASVTSCEGCGVPPDFRIGKATLPGGLFGVAKDGPAGSVIAQALDIALNEKYIAAVDSANRHDQALISLLMYKEFANVHISDGNIYLGWKGPSQVPGQKVWVHRRGMDRRDLCELSKRYSFASSAYFPYYSIRRGSFLNRLTHLLGKLDLLVRAVVKDPGAVWEWYGSRGERRRQGELGIRDDVGLRSVLSRRGVSARVDEVANRDNQVTS